MYIHNVYITIFIANVYTIIIWLSENLHLSLSTQLGILGDCWEFQPARAPLGSLELVPVVDDGGNKNIHSPNLVGG